MRKVIYAQGGDASLTISRPEAELLFDFNDATVDSENAPSWQNLFVHAIASHLMFPRAAPTVASADEVQRRETWLDQRRGIGGLLASVGKSVAKFSDSWKTATEADSTFT